MFQEAGCAQVSGSCCMTARIDMWCAISLLNITTLLAAGQTAPLQTVCAGDSGGPLLVTGADAAKDYQIGIVSFSAARCDDEYSECAACTTAVR